VWHHNSGEVGKLTIFWCEVSSGYCTQKLWKSIQFIPSYSKYKKWVFFSVTQYIYFVERKLQDKQQLCKHENYLRLYVLQRSVTSDKMFFLTFSLLYAHFLHMLLLSWFAKPLKPMLYKCFEICLWMYMILDHLCKYLDNQFQTGLIATWTDDCLHVCSERQ